MLPPQQRRRDDRERSEDQDEHGPVTYPLAMTLVDVGSNDQRQRQPPSECEKRRPEVRPSRQDRRQEHTAHDKRDQPEPIDQFAILHPRRLADEPHNETALPPFARQVGQFEDSNDAVWDDPDTMLP